MTLVSSHAPLALCEVCRITQSPQVSHFRVVVIETAVCAIAASTYHKDGEQEVEDNECSFPHVKSAGHADVHGGVWYQRVHVGG